MISKKFLYHLLIKTGGFLVQKKLFEILQLVMNKPFLSN